METLTKGDIVVIPFPYTNLSQSKKRPALVVATLKGDDVILCQITSQTRIDDYSVILELNDLSKGDLYTTSFIRPNIIFTVDKSIIDYKIGSLKERKIKDVEQKIIKIFLK